MCRRLSPLVGWSVRMVWFPTVCFCFMFCWGSWNSPFFICLLLWSVIVWSLFSLQRLQITRTYQKFLSLSRTAGLPAHPVHNRKHQVSKVSFTFQSRSSSSFSCFFIPDIVISITQLLVLRWRCLYFIIILIQYHNHSTIIKWFPFNPFFRCHYMAAAYAHLKKYARTSALYTRAAHRIDDAVELVRVPKVDGREQPLLQPNQGTSPLINTFYQVWARLVFGFWSWLRLSLM